MIMSRPLSMAKAETPSMEAVLPDWTEPMTSPVRERRNYHSSGFVVSAANIPRFKM